MISDQELHAKYKAADPKFRLGIAIGNVLVSSGVKPRTETDRTTASCSVSRSLMADLADEYQLLFNPQLAAGAKLLVPDMKPIPVTERLPEYGDFLAWMPLGWSITKVEYGQYTYRDPWGSVAYASLVLFTHWLPLPPPPEPPA